ncbi:MAG: hypothetical protein ACD_73C00298G0005 [uncultured bacterium]|nr:MAG: hypothetical protein ACD_73C00298G0005 [uncultured bacterium]
MKLEQTTSVSVSPIREPRPAARKDDVSSKKVVNTESDNHKTSQAMGVNPAKAATKAFGAEGASKVAQELQNMVDDANIKFVVKDPTGSGSDNVVIEVRDKNNKVIARIPQEVINDLHQRMPLESKNLPKGLLLDDQVK